MSILPKDPKGPVASSDGQDLPSLVTPDASIGGLPGLPSHVIPDAPGGRGGRMMAVQAAQIERDFSIWENQRYVRKPLSLPPGVGDASGELLRALMGLPSAMVFCNSVDR